MLKIAISESMAQKLKEFRTTHNVKAKDIATHINKTAAYYSKLENAAIKTIEKSDLEKILNFITKSNDGYSVFMTSISSNLTTEELNDNNAFMNFDLVDRKIPVPESFVDYLNNTIISVKTSIPNLVNYINTNEDIAYIFKDDKFININDFEKNRWYNINDNTNSFLIVNLDIHKVEDLLSKKSNKANWITLYSLVKHLLKLKHNNQITDTEFLKNETNTVLTKFKIYSLIDRAKFARVSKSKEELNSLLSDFDKKNLIFVNKILNSIRYISDYDVTYANKMLEKIASNLDKDPSFAFRFMSTDISKLSALTTTAKKNFFNTLEELISETKECNSGCVEIFD